MIYKETILSKNSLPVPVFQNGKPMHSKYNPANEILASNMENKEGFFLIMGIGAGYHIKNFIENLSSFFVVAVEGDKESLDFCRKFPINQELLKSDNVKMCSMENLSQTLIDNYIPSMYGNFFVLSQRAWQNENASISNQIESIAKDTLKTISNDYSVQAHFGKIWMNNIISNLRILKQNPNITVNKNLTAAVIAAGPSFDASIRKLAKDRKEYCIISTDTAFSTLVKSNISPDIVVSVDAQQISTTHFLECPESKNEGNNTFFVFDICTNPAVPLFIRKKGYPVFFIQSGHPLSALASETAGLPYIETGAGTVTIACCDLARVLGFKKIELFGADFSYSKGKPYARGTYLETQFLSMSNRYVTQETKFAALMYRTELKKGKGDSYTSDVLQRYENTLLEWAKKHGFSKENNFLASDSNYETLNEARPKEFDFNAFIESWTKGLNDSSLKFTLLPYIAFLQAHKNDDNIRNLELYNLAYSKAIRYNKWI